MIVEKNKVVSFDYLLKDADGNQLDHEIEHAGHRMGDAINNELAGQIHQPRALGEDRHAGLHPIANAGREWGVGAQPRSMHLREAATDVERVELGERVPAQSRDDFWSWSCPSANTRQVWRRRIRVLLD